MATTFHQNPSQGLGIYRTCPKHQRSRYLTATNNHSANHRSSSSLAQGLTEESSRHRHSLQADKWCHRPLTAVDSWVQLHIHLVAALNITVRTRRGTRRHMMCTRRPHPRNHLTHLPKVSSIVMFGFQKKNPHFTKVIDLELVAQY